MIWLLVTVLLSPSLAWANGETLYVRPAGTCANNGNGSAYGCAASAGAAGAWNGLINIVYFATTASCRHRPRNGPDK